MININPIIFCVSWLLFSGTYFNGKITYKLKSNWEDKTLMMQLSDTLVQIERIGYQYFDPDYQYRDEAFYLNTGERRVCPIDGDRLLPRVSNDHYVIEKAGYCPDTPQRLIAGYPCRMYKVVYQERINEFGSTTVYDKLWICNDLKVKPQAQQYFSHPLFANPTGHVALEQERIVETISIFEETFTSRQTCTAVTVSPENSTNSQ